MLDWIERHAVLMSVVIWPLLTAIATALFKPRTPEQYAELPPRLAAFLKLVGAIGLDVPNLLEAVRQGVRGTAKPASVYRAERAPPIPVIEAPPARTGPTPIPSPFDSDITGPGGTP